LVYRTRPGLCWAAAARPTAGTVAVVTDMDGEEQGMETADCMVRTDDCWGTGCCCGWPTCSVAPPSAVMQSPARARPPAPQGTPPAGGMNVTRGVVSPAPPSAREAQGFRGPPGSGEPRVNRLISLSAAVYKGK
jgi:hypothetical protein